MNELLCSFPVELRKTFVISFVPTGPKNGQPWLEAGYECWIVDTQHPPAYATGGVTKRGRLHRVHADLRRPWLPRLTDRIAFSVRSRRRPRP